MPPRSTATSRPFPLGVEGEPEWLARKRSVSIRAAADFKNLSVRSFTRHFANIIRKPSPRRRTVLLGDLLDAADD